jgi:hypothetical protein
MLVRHLHGDLFGSLVADITRQQGAKPRETTIAALVADRDWLFDNDNYHIDTTHLSSVVRFALLVDDPDVLRLALELTAYGERLAPQFRFPGNEPFTDLYPSAALFIEGLLGTKGDEARAWFKERADQTDVNDVGTYPAEVYISLLARTGQISEAIDALARLLPAGTRTGGFAPSLLELAQTGHEYRQLTRVCREQGDLVGYAAGLLSARLEAASQRPA